MIFAPWQQAGLLSEGALSLLGAALSYAIAFAYTARKLPPNGAPLALSVAQLMTATALTAVALPVATAAATVGYLLPAVSIALGALFLDEPLTPRTIGGMAIVPAAVALTRWKAQTSSSTTAPGALAVPK
ncbi:hypothetical protein [Amycolatopsis sp. NBC_00348]|uniref:hypothetical protein n=1 Tax=Amycolatopsis sp. NBC_00348 TaxID=2975956 RepID=UPI003FA42A30